MHQQKRFFSQGLWVVLSLMFLFFAPVTGHAATFMVNSTDDIAGLAANCVSGVGPCTLRSAVQAANANLDPDDIVLSAATYTLSIPGAGEELAATGDLDIGVNAPSTVTIIGENEELTIIDGSNLDRLFETIAAGTSVTIRLVTIRNGNSGALEGGCIKVGGGTSLILSDAVVSGCTVAQGGGGIDNTGTLTMNTVAITNTTSPDGALDNGQLGTITWIDGEVSNNSGSGIVSHGTMTITNVTISGNTTLANGAGIDNDGTATLQNVTISNNTAPAPNNIGGIRNVAPGTITVTNTIISGNTPLNCGGLITSGGNNIDNLNTCLFTGPGDLANTDPLIRALALNGGELRTHALQTGSPAIDAGNPAVCLNHDARKFVRPVDGNAVFGQPATAICDIGAFEFRPPTINATPAIVNFGTVSVGLTSSQTVTIENTGDGDLGLGPIEQHLGPSFVLTNSLCSAPTNTLAFLATCTLTVQFAPTATGAFTGFLHIPSNDPTRADHGFEIVVNGTGVLGPVPNISVTDSIAPATDLAANFGDIAVGNTGVVTITVTNTGNANLVIGTVASANPVALPFSITNDTCSGATVAPNATCIVTAHYNPTANTGSTESFDIPSNDPGTPSITIVLTGAGTSAGNRPPSIPALVSPDNGAIVPGTTVTLIWNQAADPDGDPVTHHVSNCANAAFTGCDPVDVASAGASGLAFAGLGSLGAGIILIGFVAGSGLKRSRKALLMIAAVFLTGTLFMSCSSGNGGGGPAQAQFTVSNLTPGTTYYWKVIARDGKGGESTSEVRSYTTQ